MAVGRKGEVMTDYIKREALEQRMYHEAFENDASYYEENPMARWDSGLWIRYKLFENVLANIPPSDVVERKHGEWKHDIGDKWYCSCCFNIIYTEGSWEKPTKKFCDECGADMRKQTERNIDE